MSSGMFGFVNVLKAAADASWTREEVLTNNIANVDTPNYKRQDVDFTTYLRSALSRTNGGSSSLRTELIISIIMILLSELTRIIQPYHTGLMAIMLIFQQRMLNLHQNRLIIMHLLTV